MCSFALFPNVNLTRVRIEGLRYFALDVKFLKKLFDKKNIVIGWIPLP